ncbi:hypothetical protein FHR99_000768 [Litorivivens lipolytica]|uniref:GH84 domain-containing protein n=1 Tax=Litorivivens lipolytica TaxID=1524264 RepID=A0A7W4Z4X1_9GAMM|nr:beta-N-acetylglucosaminidase domain-containing protein [Litorivivens lipolytica]MBB3046532.1 hypothetical protein [Litorivivens lipolytica]
MSTFRLGLIEGFYGRQWSWPERHDMASFLADAGYSHYVYAPKGDGSLRAQWREPFVDLQNLTHFSAYCRGLGLKFGVGLSPMGLQLSYSDRDRAVLRDRLNELAAIGLDTLWILFDDMRGDHADLAASQSRVMHDVRDVFDGELAVCPGYYSFDPVLDEVFGERPANYLQDLDAGLDASVDILWTGAKVICETLTVEDCRQFTELTGRKPLLWDNYPVNDGRKTSPFLHLNAFTGRDPAIKQAAAGHFANPMNQPSLSKIPLMTLPQLYSDYTDADQLRRASLDRLPADLSQVLERDWARFQRQGLDGLSDREKRALLHEYRSLPHPAAKEVCDWLEGGYTFDPECLTG